MLKPKIHIQKFINLRLENDYTNCTLRATQLNYTTLSSGFGLCTQRANSTLHTSYCTPKGRLFDYALGNSAFPLGIPKIRHFKLCTKLKDTSQIAHFP